MEMKIANLTNGNNIQGLNSYKIKQGFMIEGSIRKIWKII